MRLRWFHLLHIKTHVAQATFEAILGETFTITTYLNNNYESDDATDIL